MMAAVIRALRVWREQGVADFALVLGARRAAMAAYRRLRQTLSVTLGIQPSLQSEQLFKALRSD